jgi:hypothetical protein
MPDLVFGLLHGTPATTKLMRALSRYLFILKICKQHQMRRLTENGLKPQFSNDILIFAEEWGLRIPFLPVRRKEEFHDFSILKWIDLMVKNELLWLKYIDGKLVVPKVSVHLKV